ncbi:MAG: ATP-dependent helicase HrpB [Lysobacterales bacterium CG02_land_8_20_14_3_00_62_12]|nr:MAG: ATP-dependent helicase HrpB [Xanthomonadales bacterium CG02_land_8_20_14_3_00_62_12]
MSDEPRFPIEPLLPALMAQLAEHPRLVLEAPPGAGKTTQVPLALLSANWCTGKVLMLEPRRIAARAAATFMSAQLGSALGATVGYRIRFENRLSAGTRIEVVTEGILTRLLQDDPLLEGVSALIFDEFHERHLASDLGLALALDVQQSVRPDLRILVMSATLDGEKLARYLDAPRLTAVGRSFPVTLQSLPARPQEPFSRQLLRAVQLALAETAGDVLCFLPGKREIDQAARLLADVAAEIAVLHGELGVDEQARLLNSGRRRRVVLSTNVAESSLTLPGVTAVVDSGLAREPRFDVGSGMSRLETVRIAQSSAAQRAGRAGRVAAGRCYRLWPESERLEPGSRPEMSRVELAQFALETKAWGADSLRFLDPPPPGALAQALDLLQALGALDADRRITAHGRSLLALGVHPRLANAMQRAAPDQKGLACDLAALLEARDPLRGEAKLSDDLGTRIAALAAFRVGRSDAASVDLGALAAIDQAAEQWRRRLHIAPARRPTQVFSAHDIGEVLSFAYPDRIARMDTGNPRRYQLANGRGAELRHDSALSGAPWLVIAELRFDEKNSLIQRAAPVDFQFLERAFADQFSSQRQLAFQRDSQSVVAIQERRFADLLLDARPVPTARDAATAAILLGGIGQLGLQSLPWSESLQQWLARVQNLRAWCPELGLPDVSETALTADLSGWLLPLLQGKAKLGEVSAEALAAALHQRLDYAQQKALDELAPKALLVPSGMNRQLLYASGQAPVLAVKLQELFGLADTPRIAKGRVPVVLHLLSPKQTPIQVTSDLKGFWQRTYPEVKKELKGRYPKHPWPDDPWTAVASHRAKPRPRRD